MTDIFKWTMRCGRPYYENCSCRGCGGTRVQANKRRARHKLKREARLIRDSWRAFVHELA